MAVIAAKKMAGVKAPGQSLAPGGTGLIWPGDCIETIAAAVEKNDTIKKGTGKGIIVTDTIWLPDLRQQDGPKFRALANALREAARSGVLAPGSRLPPVRALAWQLRVTPGTVARAYQIAAAEGVIDSHVGRGSFVARLPLRLGPVQPLLTERLDSPFGEDGPLDLRIPQLPDIGQTEALRAAMIAAAGALGDEALDYPPLAHDRDCRRSLLGWLDGRKLTPPGVDLGPDDLVLTHGGQNGVSLVMAICLTGEKPRILLESLAYPGIRHLARQHRAEVVAVAMDDQGMLPEALDRAARHSGARMVCITPSAQNPTCARMGAPRRADIIEVARHHDLHVLEDECFPASSEGITSLRALAPDRVWHVASLSKSLSAGLRLGVVICPDGMGDAGRLTAQHSFLGMALPMTAMITRLMSGGKGEALIAAVQREFDDRVTLAREILAGTDVASQDGLPFLWLRLPHGWTASTFMRRAADQGVLIRSADEFTATTSGGQPVPNAVRIAIPGRVGRARLAAALRRLRALHDAPPGEFQV